MEVEDIDMEYIDLLKSDSSRQQPMSSLLSSNSTSTEVMDSKCSSIDCITDQNFSIFIEDADLVEQWRCNIERFFDVKFSLGMRAKDSCGRERVYIKITGLRNNCSSAKVLYAYRFKAIKASELFNYAIGNQVYMLR